MLDIMLIIEVRSHESKYKKGLNSDSWSIQDFPA